MTARERMHKLADGTRTAWELSVALGVCQARIYKLAREERLVLRAPGGTPACDWTDEQVVELKRLWAAGMSLTKIGLAIGVSRNAVIGKARRLGFDMRGGQPANLGGGRKPGRKPIGRQPSTRKRATADGPGVSLINLKSNQCAFILGEPRDFRCCGEPVHAKAWCARHAAAVYKDEIPGYLRLPDEKRRRKAA